MDSEPDGELSQDLDQISIQLSERSGFAAAGAAEAHIDKPFDQ